MRRVAFKTVLIVLCSVILVTRVYAETCPAGQMITQQISSTGQVCAAVPVEQAYELTTLRLNAFPVFKDAIVSSGSAVFQLTTDGTSGGAALFPNAIIQDSIQASINDATAPYETAWVLSNSNKTLTVTTNKSSGLAVLTFTLLGIPAPAPNGTSVKLQAWGY